MIHTFTVTGMTCGHCEKAVTQAILGVDAQAQVRIDRQHNTVEVDTTQPRAPLEQAISAEGYSVS